ncbi:MAG: reverse transcriptase domain-containing protein [Anaerofustis sp.]
MKDNHYQTDIVFLKNDSMIASFVDYYHHRQDIHLSEDRIEPENRINHHLILSLIDKHLKPMPIFSYPKLIRLNKMNSAKQRIVFVFPEPEQLLLKYLNYAVNTLDLNIHPNCYSFQQGKRISDVICTLRKKNLESYACIKLDIRDYFNSIDTSDLSWLPNALREHWYIYSVIEFLLNRENVYVGNKLARWEHRGVMAGIPIAPTLSNLYLHAFDAKISESYPAYARYSDDMLIFCSSEDISITYKEIEQSLNDFGLQINYEKTTINLPGAGYEFLGLRVTKDSVDLSESTIQKMKNKIKRQARTLYRWRIRNHVETLKAIALMNRKFNRKFYGLESNATEFTWSKYFFSVITVDHGLKRIDQYYQETIRTIATGRYNKSNYRQIPYDLLKKTGYRPLLSEYYQRYKHHL